jgi:glucose-1-phosphate cytidylyltransferase
MKVVILAGGLGTRLAEETEIKPKPMVEVGGRPILWHILKHYARFGFAEFYVALGYRGDVVKRYFLDYARLTGSIKVDLARSHVALYDAAADNWVVHLIETGADTNTGGRVRRLRPHLSEPFMLTYGDGVCDLDLGALVAFHRSHGKIATMTAVRPPARFGSIDFDGDRVSGFREKSQIGEGWINGGFMVFQPTLFDYLAGDDSGLEIDALERLAAEGQLMGFRHGGFWQCMDTLRDKRYLESLWQGGKAPWRVWQ